MRHLAIFRNASRLREAGNAFILAELAREGLTGIAPSHGDILAQLLACESRNMGELARKTGRSKSTVTALVAKLEQNGYVERRPDPDDSRGVRVRLTPKGRALQPAFERISEGLERLVTSRLTAEEARQFDALLEKCLQGDTGGRG